MANGYYLFSCSIVSKSSQSAVAMAAYRSGEKLYSLRDGETKSYKKRFIEPESFILKPNNAPEWTLERKKLWNEVEHFEKRDNAQIARNVLVALPNDMTNEQQTELTKEYVQEDFVDEGMIADVSIHRDDVNNPHAHILLTTRQFDQKGNWEESKSRRVPKLDDQGNQIYNDKGWRETYSVKINDWDKRETLHKWRENWSKKLNEKSLKLGLNRKYSDKSFEEQGRLEKAEIRLTRSEYQFESNVKKQAEKENREYKPTTYYAEKNHEIKQYNERFADVIHLEDYKTKRDYKADLEQLRSHMHLDERNVEATRLLVDRVKGYVDFQAAQKLYDDFTDHQNKWKLNIERAATFNNAKLRLYSKLKDLYKRDPESIKKYGYTSGNFATKIGQEIQDAKKSQGKVNAEYNKFNELKQASITSLNYQKELLDMEFSAVYDDANINKYSDNEKYFAMKMLKDYNILLPEHEIKNEMIKQGKDKAYKRTYTPAWKQAKDIIKSLTIYDRTIHKLKQKNISSLNPDEIKDTVVKMDAFKSLQREYEQHLNDLQTYIDINVENTFESGALNSATLDVKVAVLEAYSELTDEEKENLNTQVFVNNVQQQHEQEARILHKRGEEEQDPDRKQVYKDHAQKSEAVASGLFDVMKSLGQDREASSDRRNRDRTKVFRKRGADGREL